MDTTLNRIARALKSDERYAAYFVSDVRERTGKPVSHEEVLEAIPTVRLHPLPWKQFRKGRVQWTTAPIVEAVVRYLRNPEQYHQQVQDRQRQSQREET